MALCYCIHTPATHRLYRLRLTCVSRFSFCADIAPPPPLNQDGGPTHVVVAQSQQSAGSPAPCGPSSPSFLLATASVDFGSGGDAVSGLGGGWGSTGGGEASSKTRTASSVSSNPRQLKSWTVSLGRTTMVVVTPAEQVMERVQQARIPARQPPVVSRGDFESITLVPPSGHPSHWCCLVGPHHIGAAQWAPITLVVPSGHPSHWC